MYVCVDVYIILQRYGKYELLTVVLSREGSEIGKDKGNLHILPYIFLIFRNLLRTSMHLFVDLQFLRHGLALSTHSVKVK